ncbi:elongation factor 1-gamma (EF-1-gamma) [Trypanosoma cruzi]|uniref:Elongation factor 1-gamma (EF-1-gamma), putative n=1 Tax=Trypanosoma cruzi (strain CL Brener) TaxID=353153 RepID=Q4DE11_TRYCC|nr:elongation factor 1-gamma (EF-1-gamma), putative [Trypanosoma cruzi]EAN90765.1 elongation factor 1-gamma (EF-1-gamma), putative [Trypanosoma cruzi]RNC39231.1 elongation factor 1-gamma (EF-1-gamma) [Trypanosoma cruzi]|eukprot:XP_812616.1 elongation factor 1-gamma (EF-1-gamma) [Trypanosoma cruzi strain CL Brener]
MGHGVTPLEGPVRRPRFCGEEENEPAGIAAASPFVLDELKREYSHTDTRTVAAPYFFQHHDAAGCKTLRCRHKYKEENKMQRMEHVCEYCVAVACRRLWKKWMTRSCWTAGEDDELRVLQVSAACR